MGCLDRMINSFNSKFKQNSNKRKKCKKNDQKSDYVLNYEMKGVNYGHNIHKTDI